MIKLIKRRRTAGILIFVALTIILSLSVLAGDLLPLQGNVDLSGTPVSSGGLVVEIWDGPDVAGSNLIYNSTENFTGSGNISSGKFDIVLGSVGDELNLEYGKTYYMDLYIAGNDMNFSGKERQVFMSSVGTINSSFLNTSNDYELNSLLIENKTIAVDDAYLNISDGTTPRFIIEPDGQVGIGVATPKAGTMLDVNGDIEISETAGRLQFGLAQQCIGADILAYTGEGLTGTAVQIMANNAAGWGIQLGGDSAGCLGLEIDSLHGDAYFHGNVSIGVPAPTASLHIDNDSAISSAYINVSDGATPKFIIEPDGQVGIGTTTPSQKLEVAGGNVNVSSGNLTIEGGFEIVNSTRSSDSWFYVDNVTGYVGIGTVSPQIGLHIGTSGSGHSLTSNNDVMISGKLEVDDDAYFDDPVRLADDKGIIIGNSNTFLIMWDTNAANDDIGIVRFPESDGTNIPIFAVSDASFLPNGDSTYDDITEPAIGIHDDAGTLKTFISGGSDSYFNAGSVGIGTTTPSALLEIGNSSALEVPYFNISDGVHDKFVINEIGNVTIGYSGGGTTDLLVYGSILGDGLVESFSPVVLASAQGEPIPICMKNSEGNWVGCMPDANNNWKCAPNRECDQKVLRVKTTKELMGEGASDEEIDDKIESLRQKFKQGKSLQAIKDEIRVEIGDMEVLDELDDTIPTSFGIQTQSVSTDFSEDINALKSENDALKSELDALKEELAELKKQMNSQNPEQTPAPVEQQPFEGTSPTEEQQPAEEALTEQSSEPEQPTDGQPTEQPTEEPGFSITGASVWRFFASFLSN